MLSVIFRQQYVQANAQGIEFWWWLLFFVLFCFLLDLDIFWSILDANINLTLKLLGTLKLVRILN